MTRSLLGSTALLSLLFVAHAQAATSTPCSTLATPQLKISGQTSFNSWFFRNKTYIEPGDLSNEPKDRRSFSRGQLFSVDNSRLRFSVDGRTDRGMEYGLVFVLDGNTDEAKTLREDYLYFGGTWGKLYLGDTYGVEKTMAFGGFDQWGGTGFIDGSFERVVNLTEGTVHSVDLQGETSRDTKLTYLTPRWMGLQAGVSYTPTQHRGEQIINSKTSTKNPQRPFDTDNLAGGINFIHKFKCGLDMALSATGIVAKTHKEFVDTPSLFKRHNTGSYAFGGTFGYENVGFSLEYGNNGKSHQVKGARSNAGQFLDFGLSYTYGPTKFSAGYYYGWRKALGTVNPAVLTSGFKTKKSKTNAVSAAIDHKLAPGLGIYAEYNNYQLKNPVAVNEANILNNNLGSFAHSPVQNNKANAFVVGSRLVF